jgi:hypothetical protein
LLRARQKLFVSVMFNVGLGGLSEVVAGVLMVAVR